jgi:hypothetical protein
MAPFLVGLQVADGQCEHTCAPRWYVATGLRCAHNVFVGTACAVMTLLVIIAMHKCNFGTELLLPIAMRVSVICHSCTLHVFCHLTPGLSMIADSCYWYTRSSSCWTASNAQVNIHALTIRRTCRCHGALCNMTHLPPLPLVAIVAEDCARMAAAAQGNAVAMLYYISCEQLDSWHRRCVAMRLAAVPKANRRCRLWSMSVTRPSKELTA